MSASEKYYVGRQAEIQRFAALLEGIGSHWILNIFGPGGIGKTVVSQKLLNYAKQNQIPVAFVDGIQPDLTPDRILFAIKEGLSQVDTLKHSFIEFEMKHRDYLSVQEVLQRSGGIQGMFDAVGNLKDPAGFAKVIAGLGKTLTGEIERVVTNRFALERYQRGVEQTLTDSLVGGLHDAASKRSLPLVLIVDTYEEMYGLDDWFCRILVPNLPKGFKVAVMGRNMLTKVNFEWGELGQNLLSTPLPELAEAEAKAFLVHHGLRDEVAQEKVFRFTGGYPLLLVLAVHLKQEAGSWEALGGLDHPADREAIASQLLGRILREERVEEVRAFLEKGVVARWFTPEEISVVLEISPSEAHTIYSALRRHSFVERHPYGLKFHDKIRELLLERLKFNHSEYDNVMQRLQKHHAQKAGVHMAGDEVYQEAENSPLPEEPD